ncbi:MAG: hypothetical protein PHP85_10425 [Gallionella sp.]|nr:hypothetical protein [Gallionella sp.]
MNVYIALCALLLAACSPDEPKVPVPKLFAPQREALDKARAVAPAQQQQAQEQRKEIEQQTQ